MGTGKQAPCLFFFDRNDCRPGHRNIFYLHAKLDGLITKLEHKAHVKGRMVQQYSVIGLCLLVAIPIPGTGAWTGVLVAAMLDMRLKKAIPTIFLGVLIAAWIMTAVTFGVIHFT